jgi:DtxR family transcriptional regulator, Mn-dependent transcriptional regulator
MGLRSMPRHATHDAGGNDQLLTPVERSYLEVIAYLAARREPVIAAQLVRWLRVRASTVTHTIQRLEQKQFVQRKQHHSLALTAEGAVLAEQIIRRHRLLERFLYDVVKAPWHTLHREATTLEPLLSSTLEARIAVLVGNAPFSPYGNPIPGQGAPPLNDQRLITVPPGSWFVVTRIDEEAGEDSCTLQLLWARRLLPGTPLVRLPDGAGGVMRVQCAPRRFILSRRVAGFLWGTTEGGGVEIV